MISILSQNGTTAYGIYEYACDTIKEINSLPTNCAMGSTCKVLSTGDSYILNGNKEWVINKSNITVEDDDDAPVWTPIDPDANYVTQEIVQTMIEENDNKKFEDYKKMVEALYHPVKYEITSVPEGTIIDYRDKEIRVMCPKNTVFQKQSVGATGNENMYYMGFKAYAPANATHFKEGDRGVIVDELFDFTGSFAGTDAYGRNYSIVWLALASYDPDADSWTYYGASSSTEKYIGWTYIVEWYDANGVIIYTDKIRINLSNEDCHLSLAPYYGAI